MTTDGRTGSALRQGGERRDERAHQQREVNDRYELSDEVRLAEFRASQSQVSLPNIPDIPGFHVCWLTRNNQAQSLEQMRRLGYSPVTAEDIPGWHYATEKSGASDGWIAVNEMVAAKIPLRLYDMYFREVHHHAPQAEEDRMRAVLDNIREQAARAGAKVLEGDDLS